MASGRKEPNWKVLQLASFGTMRFKFKNMQIFRGVLGIFTIIITHLAKAFTHNDIYMRLRHNTS